jgi:hypothetical protein
LNQNRCRQPQEPTTAHCYDQGSNIDSFNTNSFTPRPHSIVYHQQDRDRGRLNQNQSRQPQEPIDQHNPLLRPRQQQLHRRQNQLFIVNNAEAKMDAPTLMGSQAQHRRITDGALCFDTDGSQSALWASTHIKYRGLIA